MGAADPNISFSLIKPFYLDLRFAAAAAVAIAIVIVIGMGAAGTDPAPSSLFLPMLYF